MTVRYLIKVDGCDATNICIKRNCTKLNALGRFILRAAHVYKYFILHQTFGRFTTSGFFSAHNVFPACFRGGGRDRSSCSRRSRAHVRLRNAKHLRTLEISSASLSVINLSYTSPTLSWWLFFSFPFSFPFLRPIRGITVGRRKHVYVH